MKNKNIILVVAMIATLTVPGIQSMAADASVENDYTDSEMGINYYEEFLSEEEWEEQTEYWLDDDVNTTNYYDIIRSYSEVPGLFKGKNLSIEPLLPYLESHDTCNNEIPEGTAIFKEPVFNDMFDKWDDDYLAYTPYIIPASYAWTDDYGNVNYTLRKSVSGDTDINPAGMYVEISEKDGVKHAPGDKFDPADYNVKETYGWLNIVEQDIPDENCQMYLINKNLQVTDTYEEGTNLVIAAVWPSREFVYKTRMRYWGIGDKDSCMSEKAIGGPTASTLYLGIVVDASRPISSDGKYLDEVDNDEKAVGSKIEETTGNEDKLNSDVSNGTETVSASEESKGINPTMIIIPVVVIVGIALILTRRRK